MIRKIAFILIIVIQCFSMPGQQNENVETCFTSLKSWKTIQKKRIAFDEYGRMISDSYSKGLLIYDGYSVDVYDRSSNQALVNNAYLLQSDQANYYTDLFNLYEIRRDSFYELKFIHDFDRIPSNIYSVNANEEFLFVGALNGLFVYKDEELYRYINPSKKYSSIKRGVNSTTDIRKIIPIIGEQGSYWIIGYGLYKYFLESNKIERIVTPEDLLIKVPKNATYQNEVLYLDGVEIDGNLYLSSWGNGLTIYSHSNNTWKKELGEKVKGNDNPYGYNISVNLERINDSLLLVTSSSYSHFFYNILSQKYESFESILGFKLRSGNRNSNVSALIEDQLYIGGNDRLCRYDLSEKLSKKQKHSLYIHEIKVDDIPMSSGSSIYPLFSLEEFEPNVSVQIDFRYVFPSSPDKMEYEYRLHEDNPWKALGMDHIINFEKLGGGKYRFEARAKEVDHSNSEWTYLEEPVVFSLSKVWYEKIYLVLGILILTMFFLSLLVYAMFRRKNKIRNREQLYQMQFQEERMTALRAQMNPHFLFNSLSSINNYILQENPKLASKYLTKFSHLMRKILINSKENLVLLEEELSTLALYVQMENIRFNEGFEYKVYIDSAISPVESYIPPMILQPYLENAIIHGFDFDQEKGVLELKINLASENLIRFEIIDNGKGISKSIPTLAKSTEIRKSFGMKITKERLDFIDKLYQIRTNLKVYNHLDSKGFSGTTVELLLPLIRKSKDLDYAENKY